MKRIIASILILSMLFCITACAGDAENYKHETAEPESNNPLLKKDLCEGDILDEAGTNVIGQYAYIKISKAILKKVTLQEYAEFCSEVVDNSKYNWVSIFCKDGTGIQFTDASYSIAVYGWIDEDGIIAKDIGYIIQTEDGFEYKDADKPDDADPSLTESVATELPTTERTPTESESVPSESTPLATEEDSETPPHESVPPVTEDEPETSPPESAPPATEEGPDPVPPESDPPATEEETEPPATEPPTAGPTAGEINALNSAKTYLSVMPFSYGGLIKQLQYEGYTTDEATYAADNCGADWNTQALRAAKNYLSFMPFSYSGLISQLQYEQYTSSQATYGADNCGADWYAQAAKAGANYLSIMSFTRDELIAQLQYEGYTYDQAVYGADANGL